LLEAEESNPYGPTAVCKGGLEKSAGFPSDIPKLA
jgi:hypothetical protein